MIQDNKWNFINVLTTKVFHYIINNGIATNHPDYIILISITDLNFIDISLIYSNLTWNLHFMDNSPHLLWKYSRIKFHKTWTWLTSISRIPVPPPLDYLLTSTIERNLISLISDYLSLSKCGFCLFSSVLKGPMLSLIPINMLCVFKLEVIQM